MTEKITDKVFEYIDALAAKLGVAAEYVFEMLVRQKMIEGIAYSATLVIVSIILWFATYKLFRYSYKNFAEFCDDDDPGILFGSLLFLGVVSVLVFFVDAIFLPGNIIKIFNPEYYAIKEILNAVTGN